MQIFLRPITLQDGPMIVKWRNSPKVSCHCFDKQPLTLEKNAAFFQEFIVSGRYKQFIVERIDDNLGTVVYPIATVYLKDFDETNHRCELCIFTSDDVEWNTDSQFMAISMLLDKCFNEFKMHKIYTFVFSTNPAAVLLMKRCGFYTEAVLNDEAVDGNGKYVDVLRMAVFQKQYSNALGK